MRSMGRGLSIGYLSSFGGEVVRTVPLRVRGAEQGPASSLGRCDVGRIVASTVTSEKRHNDDLSF